MGRAPTGYLAGMTYPTACESCSSTDVTYQYDRHQPVTMEIGTGQTVAMPAAGEQGVLQVTCLNCGAVAVHHVGWFDPPTDDDRWTVRTVGAAAIGTPTEPTTATTDQPDSPR